MVNLSMTNPDSHPQEFRAHAVMDQAQALPGIPGHCCGSILPRRVNGARR